MMNYDLTTLVFGLGRGPFKSCLQSFHWFIPENFGQSIELKNSISHINQQKILKTKCGFFAWKRMLFLNLGLVGGCESSYCLSRLSILRDLCSILVIMASALSASTKSAIFSVLGDFSRCCCCVWDLILPYQTDEELKVIGKIKKRKRKKCSLF